MVDSPECVGLAIRTALLLLQGEWFLDSTVGTPWFQSVMGFTAQAAYDTVIQSAILNVQGVQSIDSYSSSVTDRALYVTATVTTIYGQLIITSTPTLQQGGFGIGPLSFRGYGL